ncbi:Mitochondrial distribution and morphology protein 10 [Wickerhamiella sorbophila]|uniref:Mitochondrial distribution and morphology protein 10 n=1 Tax=Wickerhamiella sorbophila TaxID=45607 RepID=A0A2T0FL35_9ASCO|nr:Mitochondrial distribution and morphology protein 10 [Wickerhamiella sorbophila]PRT55701.1 Mitochondrial distribution and morphology protein 10 [Wickerhamiella sorbophila]
MRGYMDYLEESFLQKCGWDIQSSYANIVVASRNILDFDVPSGASLNLTSKASEPSISSWTLSNMDSIKGSMAYMYTSKNLRLEPSRDIDLEKLVQCFRQASMRVAEPQPGNNPRKGLLLYGRMFLPGQSLEAMAISKFTASSQLITKWIVDPRLIQPVVATFNWQTQSTNKSTREFIYSTHENLLGFRTLYNVAEWTNEGESQFPSKLAAGLEVYFAASKKSPGISIASRVFLKILIQFLFLRFRLDIGL